MAAASWGLRVVLALWMVSSRPSAAIRGGSPNSTPWWGAKESLVNIQAAQRYREAGDFASAEQLYQRGYEEATRSHNRRAAVLYLSGVATCRAMRFQYKAALEGYLEAKRLAEESGDRLDLGAIAFNLSNLYLQVWDDESALREAEAAWRAMQDLQQTYYRAQALLQLACLRAAPGSDQETWLIEGIEAARAQKDTALEARAWDLLGDQRLARGRLQGAERAYNEAFRLRVMTRSIERGRSYARLGALRLAQGDLKAAEAFTREALSETERGAGSWPDYKLIHQMGQIRLARGNVSGALEDFRVALGRTTR